MDESVRVVEGHEAYVVAGVVLIPYDDEIEAALSKVIDVPSRERPFHWTEEGPEARERIIDCMMTIGAVAKVVVHHPTSRQGHERARRDAFNVVVPFVIAEEAEELLIEARTDRQNGLDRATVVTILEGHPSSPRLVYGWGGKDNSALWLPDAICGATGEMLDGSNDLWYKKLIQGGVMDPPQYITGSGNGRRIA